MAIFEYIQRDSTNPRRRHSALEMGKPVAFDRKVGLSEPWGRTKARQV